jgi:hypothetical protein
MTQLTYTSMSGGIANLSVTGVKRKYTSIPNQLSTADLPAQWPRLPEGREGPLTAEGEGGWVNRTIQLVIAVCPVGQSRQPTNHALVLTLIDALCATLRAVPASNTISQSKLSWRIRGGIDLIGDTEYWLVIADITGNG